MSPEPPGKTGDCSRAQHTDRTPSSARGPRDPHLEGLPWGPSCPRTRARGAAGPRRAARGRCTPGRARCLSVLAAGRGTPRSASPRHLRPSAPLSGPWGEASRTCHLDVTSEKPGRVRKGQKPRRPHAFKGAQLLNPGRRGPQRGCKAAPEPDTRRRQGRDSGREPRAGGPPPTWLRTVEPVTPRKPRPAGNSYRRQRPSACCSGQVNKRPPDCERRRPPWPRGSGSPRPLPGIAGPGAAGATRSGSLAVRVALG